MLRTPLQELRCRKIVGPYEQGRRFMYICILSYLLKDNSKMFVQKTNIIKASRRVPGSRVILRSWQKILYGKSRA